MSQGDVTQLSYEELLVEFGSTVQTDDPVRYQQLDLELRSRAGISAKEPAPQTHSSLEQLPDFEQYTESSHNRSTAEIERLTEKLKSGKLAHKRSNYWWGYFIFIAAITLFNTLGLLEILVRPGIIFNQYIATALAIGSIYASVYFISLYGLYHYLRGIPPKNHRFWIIFTIPLTLFYVFSLSPNNLFTLRTFSSIVTAPLIYALWQWVFSSGKDTDSDEP